MDPGRPATPFSLASKPPALRGLTLLPVGTYDAYVSPGGVHDGDTLRVWIPTEVKIRLNGIQAPELATPAGKVSAVRVKGMVEGRWVSVQVYDGYKFGGEVTGGGGERMGDVSVNGTDVAQTLIAEKLAVKWDGKGPRPA